MKFEDRLFRLAWQPLATLGPKAVYTSFRDSYLLSAFFNIADNVADRLQLLGIFVWNFDRKFFLEGHYKFYRI
jgi:hypothetical protein